jgi:hypothetical protein
MIVVTKKFARRFVMVATSIIGISHRYVVMALRREMHWPANGSANLGRIE